tara:strand:- start:409 stop:897 length:489 start_codon:yes stop_codon:yes gene_type:complete
MLVVAKILRNHGVNGLVKIKSFLEKPDDIKKFEFFYISSTKKIKIEFIKKIKDNFICRVNNIFKNEEVVSFLNSNILIKESDLPKLKNGYYFFQLESMLVKMKKKIVGKVKSVNNHGAGDYLDILLVNKKEILVPLNKNHVLRVDLEKKLLFLNSKYYENEI